MKAFFQAGKRRFVLGEGTGIMGILNVTPDSFSDGGKFFDPEKAVTHALEMEAQGAVLIDIGGQSTRPGFLWRKADRNRVLIDIGGQSTRPGYTAIPWEEEWSRIEPVLTAVRGKLSAAVSVDTFYPEVARRALAAGADVINDVTGFSPEMWEAAAESSHCGCIVMHNGEIPAEEDAAEAVKAFFERKVQEAARYGISRERLCMDPGIGFGKTYEQNLQLLAQVKRQKIEGVAYLMAASRKRVIGQPCGNPPFEERMAGTLAAHTLAVAGGADFLRVHDVKEAVQAAKVADAVLSFGKNAI